ncbi:glycosyltransferase family 2 protein [uncultured Cohaesibacter sp.]|uniref:glycosyltransferase family 2 protein n=1 Tax=uncultured Cohaesibacter sp. TaxID=1002546 RepID=UPI00292F6007|nr:glycosyltransferase family 2 protein [uncultured Cohaesibacter sp.]
MTSRPPVSAFIIAQDEEDRILSAINSVKDWVDEVIVVDSGSKDRTVSVAEAAGAKVFFNAWKGYGEQKRFAEDQCRNQWLLNIDADEEISPELADEIRTLFAPSPRKDIYEVHIVDVYPHETKSRKWAYGNWQYRLYDRTKGRFSPSTVHDTVRPDAGATTAKLKGKVNHRSLRSIQFTVEKLNRYSDMQVQDGVSRGRKISPFRLLVEFPFSFLKSYLIRRSCLYGWWGLVVATNYAYSRFVRIAKFYEQQLIATTRDKSD